jgi:hypothetical protein
MGVGRRTGRSFFYRNSPEFVFKQRPRAGIALYTFQRVVPALHRAQHRARHPHGRHTRFGGFERHVEA